MKRHCPHCQAALNLESLKLSIEYGLQCPECGGNLPDAESPTWRAVAPLKTEAHLASETDAADPAASLEEHPPTYPISRRIVNRKILVSGAAALLLLGGLVFYIASRGPGKSSTTERNITRKRVLNEYFQKLIKDGGTTEKDLDAIARIESFGGTFIGLTRDAMPWSEVETLAKRAGGNILDLSQLGAARMEIINWLGRAHPETLGKTTWILDGAQPMGIDSPDFGPVSTLERPRRAFIFWPGNMPTGWEWVIEPRFDEALPFENGVARVCIGDKWGLVDTSGKIIHAPVFDFIGEFSEHGCAPIYQGDADSIQQLRKSRPRTWAVGMLGPELPLGATCGLIDRSGKVLARTEWQDVQNHINGYTPVMRDGKWGYLDPDGKLAIPCEWDDAWRFSPEGFAVVTRDRKRGIIDRTGNIIIKPEWDGAKNFCKEGIAAVRRGDGWALIDSNGKLLCEPLKRICWDERRLDLGYIAVNDGNGFGLLAQDGKPIVDCSFQFFQQTKAGIVLTNPGESTLFGAGGKEIVRFRGLVWPLTDGLHLVSHPDEFGFLGEDGTFKIPLRRGTARNFSEGLAAVATDGNWGFIDKQGKTLIPEEWDEVRDFREDRAAVRRGDSWGFIDRMGQIIAIPRWTDVGDFAFERAAVTESNPKSNSKQWSFIDPFGRIVFALEASDYVYSTDHQRPKFVEGQLRVYRQGSRRRTGLIWLNTDGLASNFKFSRPTEAPWRLSREPRSASYVSRYGGKHEAHVVLNRLGNKIIPDVNPVWLQEAVPFPFSLPPKFGLADTSGKIVVPTGWDEVELVSPEWVKFRTGTKFGLADGSGTIVVQPEWDELEVITVESASIDRSGRVVLHPWGKPVHAPWIKARKGNKIQILQKNGLAAMPDEIEKFYFDFYGESHLVLREIKPGGELSWSLYHPATGKTTNYPDAATLRWNWELARSGLLWFLNKKDGRWHLTSTTGEDLGYSRREMPRSWSLGSDGIGMLEDDDGMWFPINKHGKRIGNEKWQNIRTMVEGRAAVCKNGKWGFISEDGTTVCPPNWDEVSDFSCGMAGVRLGQQWGFVGRDGSLMVVPVWDTVMPFEECWSAGRQEATGRRWTYAKVAVSGYWAAISPSGLLLMDPMHLSHRNIEDESVLKRIKSDNIVPMFTPILSNQADELSPGSMRDNANENLRVITDKSVWGFAKLTSSPSDSKKK